MTHLISTGLQNKKDVLFGNMEEIYHFHNRSGPPSGRPRASGYALLGEKIPPSLSRGISGRAAGSVGRAQGSSLGGGELQGAAHRGRKRELAPQVCALGPSWRGPLPSPSRKDGNTTSSFLPALPSWERLWPLCGCGERVRGPPGPAHPQQSRGLSGKIRGGQTSSRGKQMGSTSPWS